jgi:VanZ family protein
MAEDTTPVRKQVWWRACRHWLPVVLWMGFIFAMSTDLGSAQHTSRIIEPLILWIKPDATREQIGHVQFLVRKAAHLTEYAVLALLVLRAIRLSGRRAQTPWSWQRACIVLLIAAAYAATDEWHQSFVPSRTADIADVLIDSSGALAGLALVFCWSKLTCLRSRIEAKPITAT